jgi:hypothetical protein
MFCLSSAPGQHRELLFTLSTGHGSLGLPDVMLGIAHTAIPGLLGMIQLYILTNVHGLHVVLSLTPVQALSYLIPPCCAGSAVAWAESSAPEHLVQP